jgi:nitrate reductase delta subunit
MMKSTEIVALGYHYPNPNSAAELAVAIEGEHNTEVKRHMQRFLDAVGALSLGEWEELHTATLDLSAPFAPYVGHVIWGDAYRRGEFMSDLKRAMAVADIELGGELPDHIEPVLRYLAATTSPLPDLMDVLPGALATMSQTLKTADPDNPYCHLLAATLASAANRPVMIGGRR